MFKDFFNRSKKKKYLTVQDSKQNDVPAGIMTKCPKCKKIMYTKELNENLNVCFNCDHHIALTAYKRIEAISDDGSFIEFDRGMTSANPLDFPGYEEKIEKDQQKTGLNEALVSGTAKLDGIQYGVAVMDARFRMGSMGSVVGEKICRIIDYCTEHRLPFILFSASGGAASVGDINLSEPKALIGFAGRRVIEQTINEKLPDDFQTAEFLLEHGQLDKVIHRKDMRETLSNILKIHQEVSN